MSEQSQSCFCPCHTGQHPIQCVCSCKYEKSNEERWKRACEQDMSSLRNMIIHIGRESEKLRKEFEDKLDVDLNKWKEYYSQVYVSKKPHKCPACEGKGIVWDITTSEGLPWHTSVKIDCKSCNGKGILWG
jgi:hypothetical protein